MSLKLFVTVHLQPSNETDFYIDNPKSTNPQTNPWFPKKNTFLSKIKKKIPLMILMARDPSNPPNQAGRNWSRFLPCLAAKVAEVGDLQTASEGKCRKTRKEIYFVKFSGEYCLLFFEGLIFWCQRNVAFFECMPWQRNKGCRESRMMPVDQAYGVFWQWHSAGQFPWRTAPTPRFLGKSLCLKAYTPQIAKKICIKVLTCPPLMTIHNTSKF